MPKINPKLDLGVMVEGVVELDPMSGRLVIRYEDNKGIYQFLDLQEKLDQYKGEGVRCIVTPLATAAKLAQMVEKGELSLEDIPVVPKLS